MLQDLHSHTYYSYCGKDSPEAVIKNAIASGLEAVGISDHYHGVVMNREGFAYKNAKIKAEMHSTALKKYYEHIKLLGEKYKDYIDVWCGIEITTLDLGYTLLADDVDLSIFDYCLIENIQYEETTVPDVFEFAKRCNCKRTGLAHIDLPAYIEKKGFEVNEFFKRMADEKIFWEINVNYDAIHGFKELQYVKNFFNSDTLIKAVKDSKMILSVGFDGHDLDYYDKERVKNACRKIEELGIPMIEK